MIFLSNLFKGIEPTGVWLRIPIREIARLILRVYLGNNSFNFSSFHMKICILCSEQSYNHHIIEGNQWQSSPEAMKRSGIASRCSALIRLFLKLSRSGPPAPGNRLEIFLRAAQLQAHWLALLHLTNRITSWGQSRWPFSSLQSYLRKAWWSKDRLCSLRQSGCGRN